MAEIFFNSKINLGDRLLKPEEVAERMGTSPDWLYRNWQKLPFALKVSSRQLRFSERGLERYIKEKMGAWKHLQAK